MQPGKSFCRADLAALHCLQDPPPIGRRLCAVQWLLRLRAAHVARREIGGARTGRTPPWHAYAHRRAKHSHLRRAEPLDDLVELGAYRRIRDAEPLLDLAQIAATEDENAEKGALLLGKRAEVTGPVPRTHLRITVRAMHFPDLDPTTTTRTTL